MLSHPDILARVHSLKRKTCVMCNNVCVYVRMCIYIILLYYIISYYMISYYIYYIKLYYIISYYIILIHIYIYYECILLYMNDIKQNNLGRPCDNHQ